jgi:Na+/H+ antiporter NhaD/arsenite permease-like protein
MDPSALATSTLGIAAVVVFVLAYVLVVLEDRIHLRKSKPVIAAAGLMWVLTALAFAALSPDGSQQIEQKIGHHVADFAELFLFLVVAMTYISAIGKHNVFLWLNAWLVSRGFGLRAVFWTTGALAFVISPFADNMTTALLMGAVATAVGRGNPLFIGAACTNIVIAANAGGAFSPFGDITTLMVWQRGIVEFGTFFALFIPAVANFLIPAALMSLAVPREATQATSEAVVLKRGAKRIMVLFACTIATAVSFHNFLNLPAFLGMMTGLAYLKLFGYYLQRTHVATAADRADYGEAGDIAPFDSFREVARVEWDTLLFFFGVIMCVGGLSFVGYLEHMSTFLYGQLGATVANTLIGVMSAVVDNIPIMVGVLEMHPSMDVQQWLLVTLTAGVGGSMLSIGSAAGVALMGQARGHYTFFRHLRWTPVIALGYGVSIWLHMILNRALSDVLPGVLPGG